MSRLASSRASPRWPLPSRSPHPCAHAVSFPHLHFLTRQVRRNELIESWELCRCIVGEINVSRVSGEFRSSADVVRRDEFADTLDTPKTQSQLIGGTLICVRMGMIDAGARTFLEQQFASIVDNTVNAQPDRAKIVRCLHLEAL